MVVLCLLLVVLSGFSRASSSDLLKLQFPLYGLAEVAAREYAKDKTSCNNQLKSLFYGIQKREKWALTMLGTSGAPVSGFVLGNNYWLGVRSQCQLISAKRKMAHFSHVFDDDAQPFKVNFYVGLFRENTLNASESSGSLIHLGLCLPSACSVDELKLLLIQWTNQNPLATQNLYNFTLEFQNVRAIQSNFSWNFNPITIALGIAMSIITLLTISGTLYEIYIWTPIRNKAIANDKAIKSKSDFYNLNNRNIKEYSNLLTTDNNLNENCELKIDNSNHKSMPIHALKQTAEFGVKKSKQNILAEMVMCFSIKSNLKRFFSQSTISEELAVVNGLRFFGTVWLIWLRLANDISSYSGLNSFLETSTKVDFKGVTTGLTLVLDMFFFTGGFLLAYKYYKNRCDFLKQEQNFSIKKKVNELGLKTLRRFLRFTPFYLMVIGIAITVVKISRQVSLFEVHEEADELCPKWWWRNIAYINNLFDGNEMCLSWSWYMSTDMQFYFLGLILLILSAKFQKFITIGSLSLVILSFILTGYYGCQYFLGLQPESRIFYQLNVSPWTRLGCYLVGMLTGYFIVQLKEDFLLKKTISIICWVVAIACFVWALLGTHGSTSHISATLHAALGRLAWTFCLTWITIASCTNNAGILKSVLSFSVWTHLDKLFYSVYILIPLILTAMMSNFETAVDSNSFQMVVYFFGSSTIIYMYSFALSLLFEIPLGNLAKRFVGNTQAQNQFN